MGSSYYQIIQLQRDRSIYIEKDKLTVDLSNLNLNLISNDREFTNRISQDLYFWVSGGGTYLINDRYLVVVQRSPFVRVNPCKYSLFTGRADSIEELINPHLLVRELFEEVVLGEKDYLYYPVYDSSQKIIERAYADIIPKFNLERKDYKKLNLELASPINQLVSVKYEDKWKDFLLNFYINKNNDINVLFLFKLNLDIANLFAIDCEYHYAGENIIKHSRNIYLYDLLSGHLQGISKHATKHLFTIHPNQLTEHLAYMISLLQ